VNPTGTGGAPGQSRHAAVVTHVQAPGACLVCGGQRHTPALDGLLRRCETCTVRWTAAGTTDASGLYDASYYDGANYHDYFANAPQWSFEAARRLRWLLAAVRPVSLVEAGPAGGFFLRAARDAGIAAEGVEVSATAARYAGDRLGVPVRLGRFEATTWDRPVQAVCGFHVLEHVEDPGAFLEAAAGVLVPGGWLALEVPNIASAQACRLGADWPGLRIPYHRWHFTPLSLARLLTGRGFEIVRQDTVFASYYVRLSRRVSRYGLASGWQALRAGGRPRAPHPDCGDYIRILAQRREPTEEPPQEPTG
jgi:2-polyprenyl-3-methyl-5-hydroxy-6-metoxy-1,4-benzoquinol methylase